MRSSARPAQPRSLYRTWKASNPAQLRNWLKVSVANRRKTAEETVGHVNLIKAKLCGFIGLMLDGTLCSKAKLGRRASFNTVQFRHEYQNVRGQFAL